MKDWLKRLGCMIKKQGLQGKRRKKGRGEKYLLTSKKKVEKTRKCCGTTNQTTIKTSKWRTIKMTTILKRKHVLFVSLLFKLIIGDNPKILAIAVGMYRR